MSKVSKIVLLKDGEVLRFKLTTEEYHNMFWATIWNPEIEYEFDKQSYPFETYSAALAAMYSLALDAALEYAGGLKRVEE
jgi:hypothetical protein